MKFSILESIFALVIVGFVSVSAVVVNIPLVQDFVYGDAAEQIIVKRKMYHKEVFGEDIPERPFSSQPAIKDHPHLRKKSVSFVKTVDSLNGNIGVGTPAQNFSATYEFFYESDLNLYDTDAKYYMYPYLGAKFNSSQSTTFTSLGRNFSRWFDTGYTGRDVVNINGITANVSFAVAKTVSRYDYFYQFNGKVGLAGWNSTSNISTNLLTQLLPQLDEPIVSLWTNFTYQRKGNAQITLGAKDSKNCKSDWIFNERLNYNAYVTNATSIVAKRADKSTVASLQGNLKVSVSDGDWDAAGHSNIHSLLVAASGAVYNYTLWVYTTSCNASEIGTVEITLGTGNQTSLLVLTASDFIDYWPAINVCYVNYYDYGTSRHSAIGTLYLGRQFLNNHCVAYNAGTNKFGIASSILSDGIEVDPAPTHQTSDTTGGDDYH